MGDLAVDQLDRDALVAKDAEAAARGLGGGIVGATTTRESRASRIASVQGGVRPWWAQGSRET